MTRLASTRAGQSPEAQLLSDAFMASERPQFMALSGTTGSLGASARWPSATQVSPVPTVTSTVVL